MTTETPQLQDFLYHSIPACSLLQVQVRAIYPSVILQLPHSLNHNHHQTIFGGSTALLATLAGWCQVHVLCPDVKGNVVIESGTTHYLRPANYDLLAQVMPLEATQITAIYDSLCETNRAKIPLNVQLFSAETYDPTPLQTCIPKYKVGQFTATYVAIMPSDATPHD